MRYSYEQKRREAELAVKELRRRLTNRKFTGRHPHRMLQRIEIMSEVISDYQRAIDRDAARSLTGEALQSEATQYLLNLSNVRRLVPASANDHDGETD